MNGPAHALESSVREAKFASDLRHFERCPASPDASCSVCHRYEQERRRRCHGSVESCIAKGCTRV